MFKLEKIYKTFVEVNLFYVMINVDYLDSLK